MSGDNIAHQRGRKLETQFEGSEEANVGWLPGIYSSPGVAPESRAGGLRLEALANMGHELRTPIQVLFGYLEMLREEYREEIPKEPLAIIERMNANLHDLAETVENIMQFAQAAASAEPALEQELRPADLLAELTPTLEAGVRGKPVELRFDLKAAPASFRGCLRPLKMIVTNLARNAIKFTDRGQVTIALRAPSSGGIEIEISDTGAGISAAELDEAFQPLIQLSSSNARRYRGMGLGLTVVRHNVEALGGTLEVRSTPGLGSSFKVVLPARKITLAARAKTTCAKAQGQPAAQLPSDDIGRAPSARRRKDRLLSPPESDEAAAPAVACAPGVVRRVFAPRVRPLSRAPLHNRIAATALSSAESKPRILNAEARGFEPPVR